MARVKGAMMTRKRRNKTLKMAKGYWGSKSKHFKMAKQAVMKSGNYAFKGGENIATAAAKGIVSSTLEYYTEKLGGHLQLGK